MNVWTSAVRTVISALIFQPIKNALGMKCMGAVLMFGVTDAVIVLVSLEADGT
jgi:hypothetical protein